MLERSISPYKETRNEDVFHGARVVNLSLIDSVFPSSIAKTGGLLIYICNTYEFKALAKERICRRRGLFPKLHQQGYLL